MEPTPESAMEQTVPPGCRAEPPYQRPDTRLRIVLSYWLIFFLGLPFWWRTTSIERLALPRAKVEQISNLKNELRIPVSLNLTSEVSGLDIPDLISKLQVTLGQKDAISEALQLSFTDGSLGAVASQDCGLGSPTACAPSNDHYSIKFVPPTSEHSIEDRSLQVPFHPTSNFAQDLSKTLTQLLLPPATDTYKLRVAQYAPRYRLAFSLLNEDASVGGGATGWEIEEALARYIEPTLQQLSQLHNFTIESQVQYHAPLAFEPQKVVDGFRVDAEDLKVFVNSAEWTLASSSSNDPILHFILFIPSANRSPLHVSDPQGKTSHSNAFVLPQWGGIVVYNAPSQASAASHLDVQALHSTFHHFDTQLRSLLGVPPLPTELRHRSSTTITRWQLDSLLRYRALENVRESIDTLQSILKLVDRIKGMPVGDAVRSDFNAALDALNDVYLTYTSTSSKAILSASARALVSSSKAFFNPNMVAMLYFPVEHKYAVYTPLFAPIAVPLVVSLIRELRDFVKRSTEIQVAKCKPFYLAYKTPYKMQAETSSAPATEQLPSFPPHLFPLILQYLLPPTPPIPSHLLSNSLLQRHYFLDINPSDDPDLYFLFPAPGKKSSEVIRELEQMASRGDTPANADEPSVEYVAQEGSAVKARIPLGEKLLVIFSLDARNPNAQGPPASEPMEETRHEWRYHDVIWRSDNLPAGHPDVQAAVASAQESSKAADRAKEEIEQNVEEEDDSPEAQQKRAEEFWSGWSSPSSLDNSPAVERKPLSSEDAEASYFARYGEVIPVIPDSSLASTTASSTRPSTAGDSLSGSRALGMLDSSQIPIIPTEGYNTPTTVSSHKTSLNAIEPPSAVFAAADAEMGKTPTIPRRTPLLGGSAILVPMEEAKAEGLDTLEAGVADVIRGAWKLWNAGRLPVEQESLARKKEAFLRLIEQTVAPLS